MVFFTIGQFFQTFFCLAFMSRTAKKLQFDYFLILTKICHNQNFFQTNVKISYRLPGQFEFTWYIG